MLSDINPKCSKIHSFILMLKKFPNVNCRSTFLQSTTFSFLVFYSEYGVTDEGT